MTNEQIEAGAKTLYERFEESLFLDAHLRIPWDDASADKQDVFRDDFVALLPVIRDIMRAEFRLGDGLYTVAEDEIDAFLTPPQRDTTE